MMLLQTLIAFLVAIAVLVTFHELGHYWAARLCGVKVLRFSVGMGKVIYSRRVGPDRTEWALSILPIGGYVKMLDAREQDAKSIAPEDLPREFTRQSVWKRMAIVAAGPVANFLLAIGLFAGLYLHGVPEPLPKLSPPAEHSAAYSAGLHGGDTIVAVNREPVRIWSELHWQLLQLAVEKKTALIEVKRPAPDGREQRLALTLRLDGLSAADLEADFLVRLGLELERPKAVLSKVIEGGVAARAGLRDGDFVQHVNGRPVADGVEFVELVRASPGKPLTIDGVRNARNFEATVTPASRVEDGKTVGKIDVALAFVPEMTIARDALPAALGKAVRRTWDTSVLTLRMLGKMIVGQVSWKNITGPISIADYAGQTARIGAISYIGFLALISVSLGVMNLLPIPVLDGGLLLYYSLEVLTGRPVSERFSEIAQRAGIGILMTLMLVAVFNDIVRLTS